MFLSEHYVISSYLIFTWDTHLRSKIKRNPVLIRTLHRMISAIFGPIKSLLAQIKVVVHLFEFKVSNAGFGSIDVRNNLEVRSSRVIVYRRPSV